ncbi:putative iron-III ABC transporter periplasmic substrate-binding protein [Halosimplex carlsbadense 2-9-1]|uniref:Putative iron-III ABC transporter periplasmic substrate-binding protein n=1 Tax=Halosimplex carlsbadense 2-9-1 TaxID=797114 RepID=M0CBA7_9EURY|nr:ABC transporter substrate-binding protein [Halosimplex carlsbadense]ELZ20556.1 putative iron-III ABC transporter periplasmic substrate-binding protein [Halosimplex carlsbadense 2-9-1]
MSDDETDTTEARTRRDYLKYGAALAAAGLVAGCAGGGSEPTDGASDDAGTATDAPGDTPPDGESTATAAATESYSVRMAPVGEVTFDAVPERWIAYCGEYADMGVALGQADGMAGIGGADRYYTAVYDELPGVSVDSTPLEQYPTVRTREAFYELDCDVHLYDPGMLKNWFDWDQGDVEEVADNVAPFVGNLIFRRSDGWHDYRYYSLYEAFETVAAVFQERERFEAFQSLHDDFLARIQTRLPPAGERPSVMLTFEGTSEPETFSPYRLTDKGTSKKQWRDLGVGDALAGTGIENLSTENRGELDYENLLSVDPDVLLVRGHERKSAAEFRDTVLAYMEDHPVGSELTAVQSGRVYRGGYLHQGPIHNLFLTERAAKQLFPEEFGDVTGGEELFDRQRVADIVNGDL